MNFIFNLIGAEMSKDLIVKANDVVRASYHLSVNEQRLVLSALAQLPKGENIAENRMYFVKAENFIELGVHPKTAYRELKQAVERLYNRSIIIHSNGIEIKTRWVQFVVRLTKEWIIKNKNLFEKAGHIFDIPAFQDDIFDVDVFPEDYVVVGVQFAEPILPFLVNLKDNFTSYLKQDIAGLSGAYSIRIYELIMQFKSSMYVKLTLKELRNILELGDKYPLTADLKRWVIDLAINEISEKSPITANYKLIKTGKKFTHLEIRSKYKKNEESPRQLQRDPNTIDWVNGATDNENKLKLLTQKQADYFSSKLANDSSFGSKYAGSGESMQAFTSRISNELQRDISKVTLYMPHLIAHDYGKTI